MDGKGYGLFLNEDGCIELRINEQKITTGAPVRDHAWHFIAATFNAETGEAVLYHEPQIVYALDPAIPPVKKKLGRKIDNAKAIPVAIAGYTGKLDNGALAKSSKPAGIVITGHTTARSTARASATRALSRSEIETMKLGAQPGLSERRHSGPTGALVEGRSSPRGTSPTASTRSLARITARISLTRSS